MEREEEDEENIQMRKTERQDTKTPNGNGKKSIKVLELEKCRQVFKYNRRIGEK